MKIDIILDNFTCPFSDLVDKKLFEVWKVEGENRWVVRKKDTCKCEGTFLCEEHRTA